MSPPATSAGATKASTKRWNVGRDLVAVVLLLLAPLFPWNLYFGIGIPNSSGAVFAALGAATVLSLAAIAGGARTGHPLASRLRIALNAPYVLLVVGFVGFDVVQTVRYGGSANVPGGVGPGAWLGVAGALLSAQPALTGTDDDRFRSWLLSARIVGYTSIVLATLSVSFNLFWRIKGALAGTTNSSGSGKQSFAIVTTAGVYGVVALVTVIVAARWILQGASRSSRLATTALAGATLAAGILVWLLPLGREIDGFRGIAQNTSTAGVGFEGYVPWIAAAAIFAPPTLLRVVNTHQLNMGIWRAAARKALLLIALWCLASVLMRVTDVIVSAVLQLSRSPYDSAAMAAFDVLTAALAVWIRINLVNRSLPVAVISSLCGVLLVLTVSRIVVGIALAPRFAGNPTETTFYGNNLAQQITSTFDVVLSGLALCILAVGVVTARFVQTRPLPVDSGDHRTPAVSPPPAGPDAATSRLRTGGAAQSPASPGQRPAPPPRIHRPVGESTRRMRVGPGREDATQQFSTGAPRITPPRPRPGQQPMPGTPKIHRPQQSSRQHPGGGSTPGDNPR